MFRVVASSLRAAVKPNMARTSVAQVRNMSAAGTESDAEFDAKPQVLHGAVELFGNEGVPAEVRRFTFYVCMYTHTYICMKGCRPR